MKKRITDPKNTVGGIEINPTNQTESFGHLIMFEVIQALGSYLIICVQVNPVSLS